MIEIKLGKKTYQVNLNHSATAEALAELLPFTVSFSSCGNYGYGPLQKRLPVSSQHETSKPHKHGIYYADYIQSLVIYYEDGGNVAPFVLVHIGEIERTISALGKMNERIVLTVC